MKPDIIFQSWNTESVLGGDVRHREVKPPSTADICRSSPGVSRAPENGLLALCFFAVMLSWTFPALPPSSVQNQHCCAKHSAFSKLQPSCLWSITLWSTSAQMPFPPTLVQIRVPALAARPLPSLNLQWHHFTHKYQFLYCWCQFPLC